MGVGHPVTPLGHLRHQTGVPPPLIFPSFPGAELRALLPSPGLKQRTALLQLQSLHLPSQKKFCKLDVQRFGFNKLSLSVQQVQ